VESAFRDPGLKLIETFGWDGNAYPRLPRHLARMKESAQVLGFPCDSDVLSAALPPDPGSEPLRLRLTLSRQGEVDLTSAPLAQNPPEWRVAIAPSRVVSADPRLAHKTTDRALYDQTRARLPQGIDEMLFLNERDEVAEGTITNPLLRSGQRPFYPAAVVGMPARMPSSRTDRNRAGARGHLARQRPSHRHTLRRQFVTRACCRPSGDLTEPAPRSPEAALRPSQNALQAGAASGRRAFHAGS
jgi:4-amino-4-deoxychorismate lyase